MLVQQVGQTGWNAGGTRTADGTVALSLTPGYYWAYASNVAAGVTTLSNVVYFAATDSSLAVYQRCHNAAVAQIAALTMSGSPTAHLYQQMLPDDRTLQLPGIFCVLGGPEKEVSVLTGLDDIAYQLAITIMDVNYQDYVGPQARLLLWRQQIVRSFRNARFTTVPENIRNSIDYKVAVDPRLLSEQRIAMGLLLTCVCREVRG